MVAVFYVAMDSFHPSNFFFMVLVLVDYHLYGTDILNIDVVIQMEYEIHNVHLFIHT